LDFHSFDRVSVFLVGRTFDQLLLLRAEEARRVRPIWLIEIADPEIVRLHHVEVAVEDQVTFTSHFPPPSSILLFAPAGAGSG
jgi:hypothetical protein